MPAAAGNRHPCTSMSRGTCINRDTNSSSETITERNAIYCKVGRDTSIGRDAGSSKDNFTRN